MIKTKKYFDIPIQVSSVDNKILIKYNYGLNKKNISTLHSNMLFACYERVKEIMPPNYETEYIPLVGTHEGYEFDEDISEELFESISTRFFDLMDKKTNIMTKLVSKTINTLLENYLGIWSGDCFNMLQYFVEYEEIPKIDDFYEIKMDDFKNSKIRNFYNIKKSENYKFVEVKNPTKNECKYNVLYTRFINGKRVNVDEKCFNTLRDTLNFLKFRMNFVKSVNI